MRIFDWGHVRSRHSPRWRMTPQRVSGSRRRSGNTSTAAIDVSACSRAIVGRRSCSPRPGSSSPRTRWPRRTVSSASMVSSPRGGVGRVRSWHPAWLALGLILLSALVGSALIAGGRPPSILPPPAVVAGPSDAASPSPRPSRSTNPSAGSNIVDTSTWSRFVSVRHGLTIAYGHRFGRCVAAEYTDSFLHPDAAATSGAKVTVNGEALPKDMTYGAYIDAHPADYLSWMGRRLHSRAVGVGADHDRWA